MTSETECEIEERSQLRCERFGGGDANLSASLSEINQLAGPDHCAVVHITNSQP